MTQAAGLHADGFDPIKRQVEASIRRVVTDVVALPCHVARTVAHRAGEPIAMVRALSGLTLGGLTRRLRPMTVAPEPTGPADRSDRADRAPMRPRARAGARVTAAGPSATALPLDDYESLAASQVVARLERLDPEELGQVQAFETSHRGRRTVLGKIEQLLAVAPS